MANAVRLIVLDAPDENKNSEKREIERFEIPPITAQALSAFLLQVFDAHGAPLKEADRLEFFSPECGRWIGADQKVSDEPRLGDTLFAVSAALRSVIGDSPKVYETLLQVWPSVSAGWTPSQRPRQEPADGYDFFLSYASEDGPFAEKLARALKRTNVKVWYDEFVLKAGDQLFQTIDRGLRESRLGIVVLSRAYFRSKWTQDELNALAAREENNALVIRPVWLNISKSDVSKHSPLLAGRKALRSPPLSAEEVADALAAEVRQA